MFANMSAEMKRVCWLGLVVCLCALAFVLPQRIRIGTVLEQEATPLALETPDGSALEPVNNAALHYLKDVVGDAYRSEGKELAAKTQETRREMQAKLRAQVRLIAKATMLQMSKSDDPNIPAGTLRVFEKALGERETAEMCRELALPCPITSVGEGTAMADEIAGFGPDQTEMYGSSGSATSRSDGSTSQVGSHGIASYGFPGSESEQIAKSAVHRKEISTRGIHVLERAAHARLGSVTAPKTGMLLDDKQQGAQEGRVSVWGHTSRAHDGISESQISLRELHSGEGTRLQGGWGAGSSSGGKGSRGRVLSAKGSARLQGLLMAHRESAMPPKEGWSAPSNVYL